DAARGWEAAQKSSIKKLLPAGGHASGARFALCRGRGTMSFEVVCHEHPNIFVVNRQTYETYRFTEDGALAHAEPRSDLGEARQTGIAFLARGQTARAPRR